MNQIPLALAVAQGEEGVRRGAERSERVIPGWLDVAFLFLCRWAHARSRSELFTAEDVTDSYASDPGFVQPVDQRHWGAVFKRAIKRGVIEFVDAKGRRRKGHGVVGATRYRSKVSGKRWTEITGG